MLFIVINMLEAFLSFSCTFFLPLSTISIIIIILIVLYYYSYKQINYNYLITYSTIIYII